MPSVSKGIVGISEQKINANTINSNNSPAPKLSFLTYFF